MTHRLIPITDGRFIDESFVDGSIRITTEEEIDRTFAEGWREYIDEEPITVEEAELMLKNNENGG